MKKFSVILPVCLLMLSCIENDLPYPKKVPVIKSIDVEGALQVEVDPGERTVSIVLGESGDETAVKVRSAVIDPDNTVCNPSLVGVHDLSRPGKLRMTTWQDYDWILTATRPVERYFNIKGQIGESVIDDVNRRAVAFIPKTADIGNLEVSALKLGPKDISTMVPAPSEMHDFTHGISVTVKWREKVETWTLYVEPVDISVTMKYVSPWTRVAWVAASGVAGRDNGFRFRLKGAEEWTDVPVPGSTSGEFSAGLEGLRPETEYECVAYSGNDVTEVTEFTTDGESQLPNGGFETFSHAESNNYYSWFDPSSALTELKSKWWDSGNVGSTTVGSSYAIAMPDSDCTEGRSSACLVSRNVIIKFAAGNTFSGEFAGLVGTQGGICNFGRPFTLRPRSMMLSLKYQCGTIDCIGSYPEGKPVAKGDNDRCQVWVAVGDWDYKKYGGTRDCPVQVNTTDMSTAFKPEGESVIGYGSYVLQQSTDGWIEVAIPLEYRSLTRRPTHIIVSFAASMLGDYFTGSSSSRLWVDNVRLVY